MGRYISTGSTQVGTNCCNAVINSTCYQTSQHKYTYNANECWPNRIILDTPGNYSFTLPSGATCLRTIAVGGGGKSKCTVGQCCGMAGSGGGYAEKVDAVAAGCTVTIVVGRQEQDTTIAYTNTGAVARTITGGGAAGCVAGVASGGDWNSNGGCAGCNYNLCSSYSHYCGSCICFSCTTCCGYCIVYAGVGTAISPGHQGDDCCNARYAGGGSAGSWIYSTGGAGQNAVNTVTVWGMSGGGSSAGGGGGIGYITRGNMVASACSCICTPQSPAQSGPDAYNVNYPPTAGGGGGTKWQTSTSCECVPIVGNCCMSGNWRGGHGGWGGADNNEGQGECYWWGVQTTSSYYGCHSCSRFTPSTPPKTYPWHDIHSMCGSGSSGKSISFDAQYWCGTIQWATKIAYGSTPENAGEGAGTGGVTYVYCNSTYFYNSSSTMVNWTLLCCLGTAGKVCCSDRLQQSLFPNVITCAGTLGGSGGVGICNLTSKAGKGGGAGVNRCYILCICYGGTFDLCNGSGAALAYPPSDLDWRVSNAGTGMAIIYWK